jgi:hypothetical protein
MKTHQAEYRVICGGVGDWIAELIFFSYSNLYLLHHKTPA